jgi:hypothetical protein
MCIYKYACRSRSMMLWHLYIEHSLDMKPCLIYSRFFSKDIYFCIILEISCNEYWSYRIWRKMEAFIVVNVYSMLNCSSEFYFTILLLIWKLWFQKKKGGGRKGAIPIMTFCSMRKFVFSRFSLKSFLNI